nr:hypothetical protein CFP56_46962 [Quercus suber]
MRNSFWRALENWHAFPLKVLTTMFDNHMGNPQIIGDIFASLGMKVPDGKNGPYVWDIFFLALVLGM